MYIELHAASAFSFLQGASLPEALVERAAALGYPAIALLDADGVYGAPRFHKAAKQAGLKAIIGAELTIDGPADRVFGPAAHVWRLPVLVASPEGYQNLCRLVTRMKMRASAPGSPPRTPARWGGKGEGSLALEELDGCTAGLVALAGRPVLDARHHGVGGMLDRLVGLFGRDHVCVELQRHLLRDEECDNEALTELAHAYRVPLIAANGVRFATPGDRPLFDVLSCIHHHTTLDQAGRLLARNAERYLKSPEVMAELFADRPDALAGTAALAERLEYTMADLGYRFPSYPVPPGETEMSFLRHIAEAGARDRYRPYHDKARAQIGRELDLIEKLELAGYFLIVWDIVNYCRQQDILVQGRGSAANSAVCYSLGITAVDPIKMDLLFERFLSEERGEWPDIDLDLPSGDRRERVIQHVYEKYGRLGAAMTANVITYRGRSAAREVGKALSLNEEQIDRLAKVMHHFEYRDPNETLARNMEVTGLSMESPRMQTFAELWRSIQDLPRHLGQHSGGMVVCQGALDSVVPLEPASMPGRVVIQWDKDDCADMGIVKVDLLGLGMMAVLQDAIELVNTSGTRDSGLGARESSSPGSRIPNPENQARFDLAHLPQDDPAVYELLQKAETIGVFQVESRAQMATLPRMKPTHFYDLVVEVAIIRPGPIVGDMVHPYLNRRAGREPVIPLHPCLEPVLERTLGVPLFQEQLLRMAMVAAGFTGGQAEELRRAMGFKRSEKRMKQIGVRLARGDGEERHHRRDRRTDHQLDHLVCAVRVSRVARRQLRAAGLRQRVSQGALPRRVLHGAPQQPADGVLSPGDAGQGRAAPRRPLPSDRRAAVRLGLPRRGLTARSGSASCTWTVCERTWVRPWLHSIRTKMLTPPLLCTKCGADDESMIEVVRDTRESRTLLLQRLLARLDGAASPGRPLPLDRGCRPTYWPASRRVDDAGRHRRAERVHERTPQRALASGALGQAGRRIVRRP